MKQKLIDLFNKAKTFVQNEVSLYPLVGGIIIGYFGHPIISLSITIVGDCVKLIFKVI